MGENVTYLEFAKLVQVTARGFVSTGAAYKFWMEHRLINYPATLQTIYKLVPVQAVVPPPVPPVLPIYYDLLLNLVSDLADTGDAGAIWDPINGAVVDASIIVTGALTLDGTGGQCIQTPIDNMDIGDFVVKFKASKTSNTGGGYDPVFYLTNVESPFNGMFVELSSSRGFWLATDDIAINIPINPNDGIEREYCVWRESGFMYMSIDGVLGAGPVAESSPINVIEPYATIGGYYALSYPSFNGAIREFTFAFLPY